MPTTGKSYSLQKRMPSKTYSSFVADVLAKGNPEQQSAVQEKLKESFDKPQSRAQMPIIAHRDWEWNLDTLTFKKTTRLRIFVAVELNSRRAFIKLYPQNRATAEGGLECLKALKEKYQVNGIQSDNGGEFTATAIQDWLDENNIHKYYTQAGVHREQGIVERFNKGVRDVLQKFFAARQGKGAVSMEELQTLLDRFANHVNNQVHSTTKMKPKQMSEDDMGKLRVIMLGKGDRYIKNLNQYEPGDKVRIRFKADPRVDPPERAKRENGFVKDANFWMPHIFEIVKRQGYKLVVKDEKEVYDFRVSPRDVQKVSSERVNEEPDIELEEEEEQERAQAKSAKIVKQAGLAEKPWSAPPLKEKRQPKPAAKLVEGKAQEEAMMNRRSKPVTERKPGPVKVTGFDIDKDKNIAILYVQYGGEKEQFAVNAASLFKDGEWDQAALKFFNSALGKRDNARAQVEELVT